MDFKEFIARSETDNFDTSKEIEEFGLQYADNFIKHYSQNLGSLFHQGDCTKHSSPCALCMLRTYIDDFERFTVDKEKFLKEEYE